MYTVQAPLLALKDYLLSDSNDRLVLILDTLDLEPLLGRLDRRHGRGRRGHSLRALLYAVIAGWTYDLHSMAELRRELRRNGSLRILCGIGSVDAVPSEDAFSRFMTRLAGEVEFLEELYRDTVARLRERAPELGQKVAVDSTAVRAWSNGNRGEPSDTDAAWGKSGRNDKGIAAWCFGYKAHLAVDVDAEIPLAYTVTAANVHDGTQLRPLLDAVSAQHPVDDPFHLEVVLADSAYDSRAIYQDIWERRALPIIDFNSRGWEPPDGFTADGCPLCQCGVEMRFLGRDRDYIKYGSGKGCGCRDGRLIQRFRIDDNPRLHAPLPRHTKKWQRLYDGRTAAERVNSRGKEHVRLRTLRHRGIRKARVHIGLTMLVMVTGALGMMEAGRKEWARSIVRLIA